MSALMCWPCSRGQKSCDCVVETPLTSRSGPLVDPAALADRIDEEGFGSRVLDAFIEDVFHPLEPDEDGSRSHAGFLEDSEFDAEVPNYTGSIDAAINLAELHDIDVSQVINDALDGPGGLWATGYLREGFVGQIALRLCAAILRITAENSVGTPSGVNQTSFQRTKP